MPRQLRVEYARAVQHVMSRGGRKKDTNPAQAKLLGPHERLLEYPWNSLVWYLVFT
jgi:hypothetical protein